MRLDTSGAKTRTSTRIEKGVAALAVVAVAFAPKIGIGGHLAAPPLPHHRAYGSVPRRFDRVKRGQEHRGGGGRGRGNTGCAGPVGRPDVWTCARNRSASRRQPPRGTWSGHHVQFFEAVGAILPLPPEVRS